jgi:predicted O-linked N-acetylglucosamine transferase (SPINDLY family)
VRLKPTLASAHYALGSVLGRQERVEEAIGHFRTAVKLEPGNAEAWYQLGYALSLRGELAEAVTCCERAIALRPAYAEAYNTLGFARFRQGKMTAAIEAYRRALEYKPGYGKAAFNLGMALSGLARWEEARAALEAVVAQQPEHVEAQLELGMVYCRLNRRADGLSCFERVIALKPDHALAHYNEGTTLLQEARWKEAEDSLRRVLKLKPDFAEAQSNLGVVLLKQGRGTEAMGHFRQAIALNPDYAEAHNNLGKALLEEGRPAAALPYFRRVIEIGDRIDAGTAATDVSGVPVDLYAQVYSTEMYASLFLPSTTADALMAAGRRYARRFEASLKPVWPSHSNTRAAGRRLKIGYVSPDLNWHSVAFFLEPVLMQHDKAQVEVYCYYNNTVKDAVTARLRLLADHWVSCQPLSDEQLASRIRSDGIDILVDLAGHTKGNRLLVFARKPAPVQVSYLGYPATTGLQAMDWRLVTAATDPAGSEAWHSERLYRLPRSLWCYRPPATAEEVQGETPARGTGSISFGSMNNIAKVSEAAVKAWSEILKRIPGARLVMTGLADGAQQRMREQFTEHGIEAGRLRLYDRLGTEEFHGVLGGIDLALDTFPYAGTTTTCEALWLGVPVLTLSGETSVSRSGHALLQMLGLDELIAPNEAEYVQKAIELANDLDRLDALRSGMRSRFEASPLRDEAGFTRELEDAYRNMWADWCAQPADPGADPDPETSYRDGLRHLQAGRPKEAVASFEAVLARRPDHFHASHMLGVAALHEGQPEEALRHLDKALGIDAGEAGTYYNRGMVLQALKRPEEALASFDQALALEADFFEAWNNRGLALRDLRRPEEALESYRRALEIRPDAVHALNNLGNIQCDLGRYDEALLCFDRAGQLQPGHAQTHFNKGVALAGLKRVDEAAASYRRALECNPDYVEALNNLGNIYGQQRDYERAIACYERAIEIGPVHAEFHLSLGNLLHDLGRVDEALAHYLSAQGLDDSNAEAHWNEGLCRLMLGDLRDGFRKFEWRWKKPEYAAARTSFTTPPWLGYDDIAGKTILLWGEQGLGDMLQFCRYAPMVAARGGRVWLGVQPVLQRLLARLPGVERVPGPGEMLKGYDYHSPLMSLPLVFGTTLETIPAQVPYLSADAAKVAEWRERLGPARGRRIGLAWSGNPEHKNDRNRSIPLETLAPLLKVEAEFIGVQKEVRPSDQAALEAHGIKHYGEELQDFEDTAALLMNMDLVITVDTAIAHLAGALGRPVWILLPYAPDWRWLLGREDSPWYPTARLLRQPALGDWAVPVQRIIAELQG